MRAIQRVRLGVSLLLAGIVAGLLASSCAGEVSGSGTMGPDAATASGSSSGSLSSSGPALGSGAGASSGPVSSSGSASSNGGASSSGAQGTSSGGSSSGGELDGSHPSEPLDASTDFDVQMAPMGLAGFAFVVNGVEQTPLPCLAESWEYPPPSPQAPSEGGFNGDTVCNGGVAPCPGLSVFLVNTGQFPLAYTAQTTWQGPGQPPGVQFGNMGELSGVLEPGEKVDITSVYVGGITAVLGSSAPFTEPDAGKYVADGTTIPWPAGVAGSGGASEMYVAEIDIVDSCGLPNVVW